MNRKITWQPPAGSAGNDAWPPVILGDNSLPRTTGAKYILWTLPTFTRSTQKSRATRASTITPHDRRNLQTTYRFLVRYQFATDDACSLWLTDLGNLVEGAGILRLDYPSQASRILAAVWDSIEGIEQTGVGASVTFTFAGGAFETPLTP